MKRISTATRVLNKFGAGKDGYTDGDVVGGIPATDLEASLFDNVQEEIANVVEAAGIALNGAVMTQLLSALTAFGHGQCRLSVVSTTSLKLSPFNGNSVIVNGLPLRLPAAGITISNGGLAASTLYYVYLSGTTAAPALALSTTAYSIASSGVATKSTDATQTLVGMIYTNSSSQFVDSQTARLCLNWFNRRSLYCNAQGTGLTTASASMAELSTSLRCQFLTWADEALFTLANGSVQTSSSGGVGLQGFLDGLTFGISQSISFSSTGLVFPASSSGLSNQAEGLHTAQVYSLSTAGTATWNQIQNIVQFRG